MRKAVFLITLLIVVLMTPVVLASPSSQEAEGQVYIVQANDWLSKIAEKYYGDIFAYPAIVEATRVKAAKDSSFAMITDPNLIVVGQKLWIPATPGNTVSAGSNLTLEALKNGEYRGIYDQPVQLIEGEYVGEPFVEGGAARPMVKLVDEVFALGDLNGDDLEDAAVFLVENSGGSGNFIYLAVAINQAGQPFNVATQFLGDRVGLTSIAINRGQITVSMVTQGPNDPLCCPTLAVTLAYRLQGDRLVEQTGFAGVYSARLPAASSPGREIILTLNTGNTAEMSTDYLNGQPPIVATGQWANNNNGTVTVTLTEQAGQAINDFLIFSLSDGKLIATVYDRNLYGSEGLQLIKH